MSLQYNRPNRNSEIVISLATKRVNVYNMTDCMFPWPLLSQKIKTSLRNVMVYSHMNKDRTSINRVKKAIIFQFYAQLHNLMSLPFHYVVFLDLDRDCFHTSVRNMSISINQNMTILAHNPARAQTSRAWPIIRSTCKLYLPFYLYKRQKDS